MTSPSTTTTAERLRTGFDPPAPLTVGIEEELMLLHPTTLDLAPVAAEVLERLSGDARFKPELPAAQVELLTRPAATVCEAAAELVAGRRDLAAAAEGLARPAGSGTHPFAPAEGELNGAEHYRHTRTEYGAVAPRQLVFGLHVHVRVSGAQRALAVYNALRSHLPELAALAANAPFHEGRDTGLASIRPKISETLPRQGVPPAFDEIEQLAEALDWGTAAGALAGPRTWWWELRLHPYFGTVEVRVPDQQARASEAAAVAAVVHCLVGRLCERHDAGELLACHPTWRIAENRWSAARHGLEGAMADLDTGERRPTRDRLRELLEELAPVAERLGAAHELGLAGGLVEENGAVRQRAVAARRGGLTALTAELAERFLA